MRKSLSIIVAIALMCASIISFNITPQPARAAVEINRNRIKQIIYPTLGFPAIVRCGDQLTIEFDPRDQDWSKPLPYLNEFQVSATTTNSSYPVTLDLPVEHAAVGFSNMWPEYSPARQPEAFIYLVTVTVPEYVPLHLYDLTVKGKQQSGSWLTDSQPHALQTVDEFKDDFNVAQLTDIHVWGPEAWYPGANSTHERNYRHQSYSETDGYGATFYNKTIKQMNRQNPDFIVFTGDYDFSEKWLYQENYGSFSQYKGGPWDGSYYEPWFEMDWFYEETLKLDVPVFMVLGNHDSYARWNLDNSKLEEDYMASWRDLFSPQYFSFDYGSDYHFTMANTMDWSSTDRNLHWFIPDVILMPGKWQGQVGSGGDKFQAGWTQARENAINEANFKDQLLWLKQDLEAHAAAQMRVMAAHTDPWKKDGSGSMFDDADMFGIRLGGQGEGRLALIKLARENKVALFMSGHDHSDCYGSIAWSAGGGEVKFVNTTSIMFQDSWSGWGAMWEFPGYRIFRLHNGAVDNFYYLLANDQGGQPLQYSWPVYQGTSVGGPSDFDSLINPAVQTQWTPNPGSSENVTCTITNYLRGYQYIPGGSWSGDLNGAFMEFPMPFLTDHYYYSVTNGTFHEIYDNTAGDHRIYQVVKDVGHAPGDGSPTVENIVVAKSATPDTQAPTCTTFQINGGAASTDVADVTLTNDAVDTGGSGLLDMMISNDDPTFAGCSWQRYEASTGWTLNKQAGLRTVYIKFRDAAMPGNVSITYSDSIALAGLPPTIASLSPDHAYVGDIVEINGTDFGAPRTAHDHVWFNAIMADVASWTDTKITCTVPEGVYTGTVTVGNDAGIDSADFHVIPRIDSITPDFGYNTGPVHISDLEGSGFYAAGGYPTVKLWNATTQIYATNVEVSSPGSISCDFDLTGAPATIYSVTVQNEDSYGGALAGGFAVDYPPPVPTAITPNRGPNDGATSITNLAGTGFRNGIEVWLKKGLQEIKASGVALVSSTQLTCNFDLTGAEVGAWDISVQNDDLEDGTLAGAFTVETPIPRIASLSPDRGKAGDTVTLSGQYFGAVQGGSYMTFGEVRASEYVSWSTGEIKAKIPMGIAGACKVGVTTSYGASNQVDFNVGSSLWYLAEGSTAWGFSTYISVQNPNSSRVNVRITYMTPGGEVAGGTVALAPESRATVLPASFLSNSDFSTKLECLEGLDIAASRTMSWTGPGALSEEGHSSIGVNSPAATWYLPEGCSAYGFETWLLIQNPNSIAANCNITYMVEGGAPVNVTRSIAANSRATFNMKDELKSDTDSGEHNASIKVQSDLPVIPERSMYRNSRREGHDSIGNIAAANDYFLAEGTTAWGFTTWVLVQNPNDQAANVTLTYMTPSGPVAMDPVGMAPNSRLSVNVNDQLPGTDLSIRVHGDKPIIAERAMYWNNDTGEACHDSIGISGAHREFYLPDGQTSDGRETWTLVQNPNDADVLVEITYMTESGSGNISFTDTITANSRKTFEMRNWIPSDKAAVRVNSLTAGKKIIVEGAMYWNGRGAGTETIGGFVD